MLLLVSARERHSARIDRFAVLGKGKCYAVAPFNG
jgi:hypothetical protein